MPETKETDSKKPLSLTRPGRLELKKTVDAGMVKHCLLYTSPSPRDS